MDWLKLHTEARTDLKLARLSPLQHLIWFNLLCFAAEQEERGVILSDDFDLLALEVARDDTEALEDTLKLLVRLKIIFWEQSEEGDRIEFIHFLERQYDKPSDRPERVAERVRKHRELKKRDVTLCNATEQMQIQNRRDSDTEKQQQASANSAREAMPPPAASHSSQKSAIPQSENLQRIALPSPDIPGGQEVPAYVTALKAQGFTLDEIKAAYDKAVSQGKPIRNPILLFSKIITEDFRVRAGPLEPPPRIDPEVESRRRAAEAEAEAQRLKQREKTLLAAEAAERRQREAANGREPPAVTA